MSENTVTPTTNRDAWAEGYRAAMRASVGLQPTQPETGAHFPADWGDHNPYRDDAHDQDAGPVVAALARMKEWADEWELGEFDYDVADFRGLVNEVRGLLSPTDPTKEN